MYFLYSGLCIYTWIIIFPSFETWKHNSPNKLNWEIHFILVALKHKYSSCSINYIKSVVLFNYALQTHWLCYRKVEFSIISFKYLTFSNIVTGLGSACFLLWIFSIMFVMGIIFVKLKQPYFKTSFTYTVHEKLTTKLYSEMGGCTNVLHFLYDLIMTIPFLKEDMFSVFWRFITVVVMKSSIFRDIMPCNPLKVDLATCFHTDFLLGLFFGPEDGGDM
jgi:hypothetical protein